MPSTKSATKALRKEHRNRAHNLVYKNKIKDLKKEILKNKDASLLPRYFKAVDKAAKEGVIKKNTADRKKSRMAKFLDVRDK